MTVVLLIVGLCAGVIIGYLFLSLKSGEESQSLQSALDAASLDLESTRHRHDDEIKRITAENDAKLDSVGALHTQGVSALGERHKVEVAALDERHKVEIAALEKQIASQAQDFEARKKLIETNRKQMSEEMVTVSNNVLEKTSQKLAESIEVRQKAEAERARTELDKRTVAIKNAVKPVGEKLDEVNKKVESLEKERSKAQGQLGEQIQNLRQGVSELAGRAEGLTAALRKPSGRGSWGEVQLHNVIELSGMLEYCDFVSQVVVDGQEGKLRPDVVVNMPGGHQIIVDAKAPMDAFLEAQDAQSDNERDRQLERHARQVKEHINQLRAKNYQDQFDTSPELVVMFIPSEGIYHAALAADPRLLEHGIREKVLVATPTTLIGLLRAIGYGWGQERIAESAQEIASIGKELHRRIITFSTPLASVGRSLSSAVNNYNKAIASYDSRVVPQLRKIEDVGAKSNKELESISPVEDSTRIITSTPNPETDTRDDTQLAPGESNEHGLT